MRSRNVLLTGCLMAAAWFECRRKGGVNCNTAASICD
jgi:hypothetical protein